MTLSFIFYLLIIILQFLLIIVPLLIMVAFLTLLERKIISAIQRRKGPNVVGYAGLLQAIADGLKLFLKESIIPNLSNRLLFMFAPVFAFALSLISWCVIPFGSNKVFADLNLGILFLLAVSSLFVYGIIIGGWSSNSKYAFLGSLRSAAQVISYEVSIGLIILSICSISGSFNLIEIVKFQSYQPILNGNWLCITGLVLYCLAMLAETNRPPFDLPESESELVSGYNVEYAGMPFALFFLGEYANIIFMSSLAVILFFGGWLPLFKFNVFNNFFYFEHFSGFFWFSVKVLIFLYFFIFVRATLPRYRYDQLMNFGWKVMLPLSLANFILIVTIYFFFLLPTKENIEIDFSYWIQTIKYLDSYLTFTLEMEAKTGPQFIIYLEAIHCLLECGDILSPCDELTIREYTKAYFDFFNNVDNILDKTYLRKCLNIVNNT